MGEGRPPRCVPARVTGATQVERCRAASLEFAAGRAGRLIEAVRGPAYIIRRIPYYPFADDEALLEFVAHRKQSLPDLWS